MPRTFPNFTGTTATAATHRTPGSTGVPGQPVEHPIASHVHPDPQALAMRDFAHEVRNPIGTIGSAADALLRDQKSTPPAGLSAEQRQRLLSIIVGEAERLRRMVTQYLDASTALLLNDQPLTEQPLALLHDLLATCFPAAARARIELPPETCELPPLAIEPDHLRQVFLNLLENALAAIANRDDGRITISALPTDQGIAFSVCDTGGGIPPANLNRIFADGFTTGGGTRRGLGLGIVRRLLERAGGHLSVTNHHPTAAQFTFHIPSPPLPSP